MWNISEGHYHFVLFWTSAIDLSSETDTIVSVSRHLHSSQKRERERERSRAKIGPIYITSEPFGWTEKSSTGGSSKTKGGAPFRKIHTVMPAADTFGIFIGQLSFLYFRDFNADFNWKRKKNIEIKAPLVKMDTFFAFLFPARRERKIAFPYFLAVASSPNRKIRWMTAAWRTRSSFDRRLPFRGRWQKNNLSNEGFYWRVQEKERKNVRKYHVSQRNPRQRIQSAMMFV